MNHLGSTMSKRSLFWRSVVSLLGPFCAIYLFQILYTGDFSLRDAFLLTFLTWFCLYFLVRVIEES
jgi:hypothetical protein